MPTDSNGNYSLPDGYVAVQGETIQPSQHNPPLQDLATAMTARMMRSGATPMSGALQIVDGTVGAPGLAFATALNTGIVKTTGGFGISISGALVAEFGAAGIVSGVGTASLSDNAVTYPKLQKPTGVAKILGSSAVAPLSIVGAANNGSGLIRLTVASTVTLTSGTTKVVSGVVGTTEANGSWTITVIDGTKVDLIGSTFTNAWVSGGTLGGSVEELTLGSGLSMIANQISACPPGHLWGMSLANGTDATNDINIAAGKCRDENDTLNISVSALVKQLDSAFAAGTNAGGRSSASLADGTWHVFAIGKPDGTGDILFHSAISAAAVLPTGFTVWRRIGSILRESGSIVAFSQLGDEFLRVTPILDVNVTNPGTSAVTRTLSVPTGIKVQALLNAGVPSGEDIQVYLSSFDTTDMAPSSTAAPLITAWSANSFNAGHQATVRTNTSAQIRSRLNVVSSGANLRIATLGWIDTRGRA